MTSPVEIDVENDGARNTILNINIALDRKSMEPMVIMDVPKAVDSYYHPTKYRIDHINYVLHRDLSVDLWWEDDPPKLIRHREGRGRSVRWDVPGSKRDQPEHDHVYGCELWRDNGDYGRFRAVDSNDRRSRGGQQELKHGGQPCVPVLSHSSEPDGVERGSSCTDVAATIG